MTAHTFLSLEIGLFGLIGLAGVAAGPICGRICDRLHPWHALLIASVILLAFQAVQTAAGGIHVAAIIVAGIGMGFITSSVPVWQAETSPASIRGAMVCCSLSFVLLGQVRANLCHAGLAQMSHLL